MIHKLRVLNEVGRKVVEQLDSSDQVMQSVVKYALELTKADTSDLDRYEGGKWTTHYRAQKRNDGEIEVLKSQDLSRPNAEAPTRGIMQLVAETLTPLLAKGDAQNQPYFRGEKSVHSELAVPLLASSGEFLGVLDLTSTKLDAFDEQDQELIELFAKQAVIAIQTSRNYESSEQRLKRYEVLYKANQELARITARNQLDQAYEAIVSLAAEQWKCKVVIRRLDPKGLLLVKNTGPSDPAPFPVIPLSDPLVGKVVRELHTIYVPDALNSPPEVGEFPRSDAQDRAFLLTPISFENSYYGNLALSHPEIDFFRDEDVRLFEGLAKQLALTIHRVEKAEAYQEAERRAMEAEQIGEIGRQTYEILHRLGNDLGLVPASLNKIRAILSEIGLRQPRVDRELDRVLADVKGVLRFSGELAQGLSQSAYRQPKICSIRPLIEEAVQSLNIDGETVVLDLNVKETSGSVRGDSQQIAGALLNLLTNAVEAMPNGGRLTVEADGDDSTITIRISDTGRGIRKGQLGRIFGLGYTTKKGGSGFGLWSVKRTVSDLGGEITLVSEPGKGTTFTIQLPQASATNPAKPRSSHNSEPAVAPIPAPGASPSPQAKLRRILIVDDMPRWQEAIGEALRGDGFEVEAVASKAEAEKKLTNKRYDLAVLDLRLSEWDLDNQDGLEILRHLSPDQERPKVIILSGHATDEVIHEAIRDLGAEDVLSKKEFDEVEFRDGVRRLLAEGLAENRALEIHWAGGFDAAQAVAALRLGRAPLAEADREVVAKDLEVLLRRLFNRAQSTIVQRLHSGWSGAGVLKVQPFYQEASGREVIVKFGDDQQIEQERANFLNVAQPYLRSRSAMVEESRKSGRLGGLVYSLVGASGNVRSFADFYQDSQADIVKTALEKLFRITCAPWYESPGRVKPLDLLKHYTEWLHFEPQSLEQSVATLESVDGRNKLFFDNLPGGRWFQNPLLFLAEGSFIYPTYQTLTHGDFNPYNILMDEHNDAWLIDFGRSGRGHLLRDAVELDTVIRLELLSAREASLEERLLLEEALCEAGSFRELRDSRNSPVPQNSAVSKAFAACRELRWIAGGLGARRVNRDIKEFYVGAILCALNSLRFDDYSPVQKEHALVSASVMAKRLSG